MTKKIRLLLIAVLAFIACVCLFAGCNLKATLDDVLGECDQNGAVVDVTYFTNDGHFSSGSKVKTVRHKPGTKAIDIGNITYISGGIKIESANRHYAFDGWRVAELDDDGNPVFEDDTSYIFNYDPKSFNEAGKNVKHTGVAFDFEHTVLEKGTHYYLVAEWKKVPYINIKLATETGLDSITVTTNANKSENYDVEFVEKEKVRPEYENGRIKYAYDNDGVKYEYGEDGKIINAHAEDGSLKYEYEGGKIKFEYEDGKKKYEYENERIKYEFDSNGVVKVEYTHALEKEKVDGVEVEKYVVKSIKTTYYSGEVINEPIYNSTGIIQQMSNSVVGSVSGATHLEFYTDSTCSTVFTGWPIRLEDHPNFEEPFEIYAKFIKGDWTVVKTAENVRSMFSDLGSSKHYYIMDGAEIDCKNITISANKGYESIGCEIRGNNSVIKNLTVTANLTRNTSAASLFGVISSTAKVSDISFVNLTEEYTVYEKASVTTGIFFAFTSMSSGAEIKNVSLSGTMTVIDEYTDRYIANMNSGETDNWKFGGYETDSAYSGGITVSADTQLTILKQKPEQTN